MTHSTTLRQSESFLDTEQIRKVSFKLEDVFDLVSRPIAARSRLIPVADTFLTPRLGEMMSNSYREDNPDGIISLGVAENSLMVRPASPVSTRTDRA